MSKKGSTALTGTLASTATTSPAPQLRPWTSSSTTARLTQVNPSNTGIASNISDEELERAKRKVYNEILHLETQNDVTQSIANNLLYYNRRVHTKELAERVSCIKAKDIQKIAAKIVEDSEKIHVCIWGNTK